MILGIWTIYDHPKDYPEHFVVRKFNLDQPTDEVYLFASLGDARLAMKARGLVCVHRDPSDRPQIVESWI